MMKKLLFLLPVILFVGSCKSNNTVIPPVTNIINVNDTLTATIAGQNWSAAAFRLDSADLDNAGYNNGYELTGSGTGDTMRILVPFNWTDSIYAYHMLDTGYFEIGNPRPSPFCSYMCELAKD